MTITQGSDTPPALTRRERDRLGYLQAERARDAMRADARGFRAVADEARTSANPGVYGPRAHEYAAGLAARYELLATFCDWEADKQDAIAADYRQALLEGRP